MNSEECRYEVALSFAGEDRHYVEKVAKALKKRNISVFYDSDELSELWGEDLYVYLDNVYQKASLYCVMFISKWYAQKLWTNHERMSLQARDFINAHNGTVLPARFDETEIPGLRPQIGYIDLTRFTPESVAELISTKVRGRRHEKLSHALVRALSLSKDYLQAQSVASADSIAQEIRLAFKETGYAPSAELIEPFLKSELPDNRVVGYLAYQVAPFYDLTFKLLDELLSLELELALTKNETRPLWQLLVCIGIVIVTMSREFAHCPLHLQEAKDAIDQRKDVDAGGECSTKLALLIALMPGHHKSACDWHFRWRTKTGWETTGLDEALRFVQEYPKIAKEHIANGDFVSWYEIHVGADADVSDLIAAISKQISIEQR